MIPADVSTDWLIALGPYTRWDARGRLVAGSEAAGEPSIAYLVISPGAGPLRAAFTHPGLTSWGVGSNGAIAVPVLVRGEPPAIGQVVRGVEWAETVAPPHRAWPSTIGSMVNVQTALALLERAA